MAKILFLILCFLAGSIPFGVIVSKALAGVDPRSVGSGNIGATNVARAAGWKAGLLTLLLDASKGALPVIAARAIFGDPAFLIWCGFAAIVGHCLSPFLGFNGGKGVATGAGVFLAISPKAFALALLVFASVFAVSRIVSLSSILSAASMPVFLYALGYTREVIPTAFISAFIIFRHKDNIKRLLRGEEKRFKPGEGRQKG